MTSLSDHLTELREERLALPDRALFWRWVWAAVRPVVGWILAVLGAVALFFGWYGVSGQALTSKQLPYLVSGGLVGIALVIMAGVFLATEDVRRELRRLDDVERKVGAMYALLVEEVELAPAGASARARSTQDAELLALPTGTSYHVPGCALVAGKPAVQRVTRAEADERGLRPCRVCAPPA